MPYGGGVAVRITFGELFVPSGCGCLDFGCWSQHVSCTKHLLRVDVLAFFRRRTVVPAGTTPEKLFCALVPVFSKQRVVSTDTPRECQTRRRGSHEALGEASPRR